MVETAEQQEQKKLWETDLGRALQSLVENEVRGDVRDERAILLSRLRRNLYYWHGNSALARSFVASEGPAPVWVPAEQLYRHHKGLPSGYRDYNPNFVRADGKKFISVVAARVPTLKAVPENATDEEGLASMADNEALLKDIFRKQRMDLRIKEIAQGLWTCGTVWVKTRYHSSRKKYGYVQKRKLETEIRLIESPDGMDLIPVESMVEGEPVEIPRGMTEIEVHTGFTVTTNFDATDEESVVWLLEELDVHKAKVFEVYPEFIDLFRNEEELYHSDSDAQDASDSQRIRNSADHYQIQERRNRLRIGYLWLKPGMFLLMNSDKDEDMALDLLERFPEGAMVTLINGKVVSIEEEALLDIWTVIKPEFGADLWQDAIVHDYIPMVDMYTDIVNKEYNRLDHEIPKTLVNTSFFDPATLTRSNGEEFVGAELGAGKIEDFVFRLPAPEVQSSALKFGESMLSTGRENAGLHPAMWGGGGGPTKTAREAELQNNQALRQLNPLWDALRFGVADIGRRAVLEFVRNSPEDETPKWNFEEIRKGNFAFVPEESMPQTWGQQRDHLLGVLTSGSPEAMRILGLNTPTGMAKAQQYVGITGIQSTDASLYASVHEIVGNILSLPPEQLTPEVLSEVAPVDPFLFPPEETASILRDWLLDDAGRAARRQRPDQWRVVLQWGHQYMQILQGVVGPAPAGGPAEPAPGGAPSGPIPETSAPPDIGAVEEALVNPDVQGLGPDAMAGASPVAI